MVDIAPSLYERVNAEFKRRLNANSRIKGIKKKIESGEATYKEANDYAVKVGEALKESFKTVGADDLPDGKMYYNIASRVIGPNMEEEYEIVAEAVEIVQKSLNTKAGLGLNAIRPQINAERIKGIIDRVSEAATYEEAQWLLGEPVVNFAQYVVDESVKQNAGFQAKAGLKPQIIRTAEAPGVRTVVRGKKRYTYRVPCEWCAKLAGAYDYYLVNNTGNDVFRRHENCRCEVTYNPGDGKRQNVWNKNWLEPNPEEVNDRIAEAEKITSEKKTRSKAEAIQDLEGIGFKVNPNIAKINGELLDTTVTQLADLDEKYKIIGKLDAEVTYNGRYTRASAGVKMQRIAPKKNELFFGNIYSKDAKELIEETRSGITDKWFMPAKLDDNTMIKYTVTHEYGHLIHNYLWGEYTGNAPRDLFLLDQKNAIIKIAIDNNPQLIDNLPQPMIKYFNENPNAPRHTNPHFVLEVTKLVSEYGKATPAEFFAEVFANSQLGEPNILGEAMLQYLEERGL